MCKGWARLMPRINMDWQDQAACAGAPTEIFFPDRGGASEVAKALTYCNRCPVRAECLEYGLWELEGIFGGTGDTERRLIRKERGGKMATRAHGTRARYVAKCRCELCLIGNREYMRKWRRSVA